MLIHVFKNLNFNESLVIKGSFAFDNLDGKILTKNVVTGLNDLAKRALSKQSLDGVAIAKVGVDSNDVVTIFVVPGSELSDWSSFPFPGFKIDLEKETEFE